MGKSAAFADDDEIECRIIESYGIFSQGIRFWNKEVNLVSWNGRPAKLDIRNWRRDHAQCGKGIAITIEEAEELVRLLNEILKAKPKSGKAKSGSKKTRRTSRKRTDTMYPQVPRSLEPFYDELELLFGAGAEECKRARNFLLKKYHPDKNAGNVDFATRKTIKIKEAYDKILAWWNENGK